MHVLSIASMIWLKAFVAIGNRSLKQREYMHELAWLLVE